MNKKTSKRPDIGFYIFILLILVAAIYLLSDTDSPSAGLEYSQMREQFENHNVSYFRIEDGVVYMDLKEPINVNGTEEKSVYHELLSVSIFWDDLKDIINAEEGLQYDLEPEYGTPWWVTIIPYVIIMIVMVIVWYVMMNRMGGGSGGNAAGRFGHARTRLASEEKRKVTFNDVAGADEEKAELEEIVDFLKDPKKYTELGARIPKGVLLVGPPGTGKTLLAKAVAGEANVQFLSISGSDFVELYVGVGASRVRDLFEQAKKLSPAIIFIDEIDAVGRQRGSGLGGGHDEREQTLNQLLVEMDGFNTNDGVIVMAATNRADILDSALLRPGRFDRQVYVGVPDIRGREAILRIHSRGKSLAEDVDLASIARGTPGFTGADLENVMNEAALLAARRNRKFITMEDVDEAILKVQMGPEKKSRKMSDKARKLTAYHESGHAITGRFLKHADPVHYITIIPRGQAGGYTLFRPEEDLESYQSKSEMFEDIVMSLGGRTAERLFLDDISTGASGDIQSATNVARAMVTRYGMSDRLGPISYDSSDHSIFIGRDFGTTKSYSEETAAMIDEEVKRIFDEAAKLCEQILTEHKDLLIAVAEYLLVHESMTGEEFKYMCEHQGQPPASALPEGTQEAKAEPDALDPLMDELRAQALEDARRTELEEKQQKFKDQDPGDPFGDKKD